MPDEWADWASLWKTMSDTYGISHNDTDMSSSEELQMFATEGEKGTKDIGDVGYGFAGQAVSEDLVQGYKTSYWDSVPDWAKGEDGKWMVAYTGVTTFLVNTDQVDKVPTSWQDIKDGDYKVALGPLTGGSGCFHRFRICIRRRYEQSGSCFRVLDRTGEGRQNQYT